MNSKSLALFSAMAAFGAFPSFSSPKKVEKEKMPLSDEEMAKLNSITCRKEKKQFIKEMKQKYNF